jgi:diphthamide synthase (EF-2-diphthine--ammonia ligase)
MLISAKELPSMTTADKTTREVRLFESYVKYVWPFQRRMARKYLTPRCRRCILPDSYRPLQDGLCPHCLSENGHVPPPPERNTERMAQQFDAMLHDLASRQDLPHHVMLLFSGGKDSSYMLHRIRTSYPNLRVLAVTVDNTFMSTVAMENIQEIIRRMGVDHTILRPRSATMEKMFRYAITHLNEKGCSGTVDQFDGDFFSDMARNLAARLGIPYIIWGLSPSQVENILGLTDFVTSPADEARAREKVAGIRLRDVFDEEEMHYWWNGPAWPEARRPRMVFPFYIWDLPETFIKQEVVRLGLMPRGDESPLVTNNRLIPLMGIVDMIQFGFSSFEPEFAGMVRQGKADRTYWLHMFETMEYAARTGRLLGTSLDETLARLGLTRSELGIKGGRQ